MNWVDDKYVHWMNKCTITWVVNLASACEYVNGQRTTMLYNVSLWLHDMNSAFGQALRVKAIPPYYHIVSFILQQVNCNSPRVFFFYISLCHLQTITTASLKIPSFANHPSWKPHSRPPLEIIFLRKIHLKWHFVFYCWYADFLWPNWTLFSLQFNLLSREYSPDVIWCCALCALYVCVCMCVFVFLSSQTYTFAHIHHVIYRLHCQNVNI